MYEYILTVGFADLFALTLFASNRIGIWTYK